VRDHWYNRYDGDDQEVKAVENLGPGLWRWAAPHPEWKRSHPWTKEVASFALELDPGLALVDPLAPEGTCAEPFWDVLDRLVERSGGDVLVFVTIPYHVRSAEALHERYGAKILGHAALARRLSATTPLEAVTPGNGLPGGVRAFAIGSPRRQEQPLYFPSHDALAFGDAVVGIDGSLRVWQDVETERQLAWYRERLVPTLEPLLAVEAERVLVTHGPPVLRDGGRKLAKALEAGPWNYRRGGA
jgi:hypothetical protein